jgi:hypothetical protein
MPAEPTGALAGMAVSASVGLQPTASNAPSAPTLPTASPTLGVASPTPSTTRARRRWPRWVLRPVLIYVASRVVTTVALLVASPITHRSILGEVDRWDSRWFLRAAASGWPTHLPYGHGQVTASTIAFFPLFPISVRWLTALTGLPLLASGMTISLAAGLSAMVAVWALVRHYADQGSADRATLLVAVFPGSFVLSLVYAEGLAITFLALGLLALMQRRWLMAGILGLLATLTTPVALAFVASCVWCAFRAVRRDGDWRALAAPVLAPVGFVTYQVWLWVHTGNANAWRLTERGGWKSYPSLVYPIHLVVTFVSNPIADTKTGGLLCIGIMVAVVAVVVAVRQRMPMPILIYGVAAAGLGVVSAPIGLRPRFLFLAFPLIIAVGVRVHGRAYRVLVVVSIALLAFATAFTASSWAVFP